MIDGWVVVPESAAAGTTSVVALVSTIAINAITLLFVNRVYFIFLL